MKMYFIIRGVFRVEPGPVNSHNKDKRFCPYERQTDGPQKSSTAKCQFAICWVRLLATSFLTLLRNSGVIPK